MTLKTINYTSDYGYTLERAHEHDAGMDIKSAELVTIAPGSHAVVGTGIKIESPVGYAAFICSRSGLAAKCGVFVLNSPGVIDAGYEGELKVILANHGQKAHTVQKGDRIAQALVVPVETPSPMFQTSLFAGSERGSGGLGSTGK